ncbi:MAG: tail fiber assembly protein [Hafnia sp.]
MKKIYYFNPANPGFYISPYSSIIPDGSVEISGDQYIQYAAVAWPKGKVLGADAEGNPAWVDAPPLTYEESVSIAATQKKMLIVQANEYMNSKQWPGKASLGRLKSDELAQYNAWLDYLDEVEAVDILTAPRMTWPDKPE